jgi:hypothetical protein
MSCSCFKHSLIIFFNQATKNGEDFGHSKQLFGATTLRNVLGTKTLAEILSERFLELSKTCYSFIGKRADSTLDEEHIG